MRTQKSLERFDVTAERANNLGQIFGDFLHISDDGTLFFFS